MAIWHLHLGLSTYKASSGIDHVICCSTNKKRMNAWAWQCHLTIRAQKYLSNCAGSRLSTHRRDSFSSLSLSSSKHLAAAISSNTGSKLVWPDFSRADSSSAAFSVLPSCRYMHSRVKEVQKATSQNHTLHLPFFVYSGCQMAADVAPVAEDEQQSTP